MFDCVHMCTHFLIDNSLKMEANGEYDYIVDGRGSLPVNSSSMTAPGGPVYQEADPYHSLGPDVSKPDTHNFTVRCYYLKSQLLKFFYILGHQQLL